MKKIIVLSGKTGSGKDTLLSNFLIGREYEYVAISLGDILRQEVEQETKLGLAAEKYMAQGELVPDDLVNNIMLEAIQREEKNIILNAYPTTVHQAAVMLGNDIKPDFVVNIDVPDEIIQQRLAHRLVCVECKEVYNLVYKPPKRQGFCDKCDGDLARRADDSPEVIEERLRVYHEKTEPVLNAFVDVGIEVITLDGNSSNIDGEFSRVILGN